MIIKIIHMNDSIERKDLVASLIELTGATVFDALKRENGAEGCWASHTKIYKNQPKNEDLLIFEDDCEIIDNSFMNYVEINKTMYDIIYIGVNRTFVKDDKLWSWGTHAMWINNKSLQLFLKFKNERNIVDHVWNEVAHKYNLKVLRPDPIDKYVRQKIGLKSYITGNIRGISAKKPVIEKPKNAKEAPKLEIKQIVKEAPKLEIKQIVKAAPKLEIKQIKSVDDLIVGQRI